MFEHGDLGELFATRVHIPRILTSQDRRNNLLLLATLEWAIPPGEDILETISQRMGALLNSGEEIEAQIQSLSETTYRAALQRYLAVIVEGDTVINPRDINPTLREEALDMILNKPESEENSKVEASLSRTIDQITVFEGVNRESGHETKSPEIKEDSLPSEMKDLKC